MSTIPQAPPLPKSPYPGIKSFRYLDQQIFSSREDETWNLLRNVLIYRAVLLYGDSGSGKSSLVNAGLIPEALKEKFISHRLRIQPQPNKEIKIERISIRDEDKPPFLPSVFVEPGSSKDKLPNHEISIQDFYEMLSKLKLKPGDSRPLLIFDQFEEFITLFEEKWRVASADSTTQFDLPKEQRTILTTLTRLVVDDTLPIKCLFVFREDYLAKLIPLFEACPQLLNQFVRLSPPRVKEAEAIIRAPFVNEELRTRFLKRWIFKDRPEISETLAQTVAQQLKARSDTGFINLSELQVVCEKLWDSSDPDKYFEEKDRNIQKVVEDYWTGVLSKLGELYEPAIVLLGHMVTASGTRNIISEPDLKTREKELTPKQINGALSALVDSTLVRREPRNKIYFYEIASEFLVPWIDQKKVERLANVRGREIASDARRDLAASEKEKQFLRIGGRVLTFLVVAASAATILALYSRNAARTATNEAQHLANVLKKERDWSGNLIRLLNQLTSSDAKVQLQTISDLKELDSKKELPRELVPVILATLAVSSKDTNTDVSQAASYFLTLAASEANNHVSLSVVKFAEGTKLAEAADLAPRVYIQVANDRQRERAALIATELRKNSFIVPGFQLVDSRHAPPSNQLRYYKTANEPPEATDPNVDKLLTLINAKDSQKWMPSGLKASSNVRSGHYELWFARDSSASDGTLILRFTDEENNQIWPEKFDVALTSQAGFKLRSKNKDKILAPAGTYSLKISVPGRDVYQIDTVIEIREGEETPTTIQLRVPDK